MSVRGWLCLLLILLVLPATAAELRLSGDERQVGLDDLALVFEDKSGTMNVDAVAATAIFDRHPELLHTGFTHSAIWLRFDIENTSDRSLMRWIEVRPATLQDVQLFVPSPDGWRRLSAGINTAITERPVAAAVAVLPVTIDARKMTTVYLRVAGPTPIAIKPTLWDPLEFRTQEGRVRLGDGVMLGGLLATAMLGALLLALFRDRIFLFNALATTTYFLGELNAKGYSLMHMWPTATEWVVRSLPLFAILGVGLNLLFLRDLLGTPRKFPRINRLLLTLLASELILIPGVLFSDSDIWAKLSFPQHFPITVVMALVGIYAAMKGLHAARYYAIAYVLLALGSLTQGLTLAGFIPAASMASYALPVGMLLNNMFLIASVVDRVIGARRKEIAAQNALLAERAAQEAKLQEAVDTRTAELNDALTETRKASQAQSQLLAYISHDLRAPLATIVICADRLSGHNDPEVRRHQATVERSAMHQLELIDDLVEYARGELDHLELTPEATFTQDWLDSVAAQAELLASQNGNRFVLDVDAALPSIAVFDAKRLRQVVLNLLANAAKFTSSGEIRLRVKARSADGDKVEMEFVVEDNGPGIPAADMERIFLPFQRRKSERQGSGLGLTIARHLVRAMGGELEAHSAPGAGTRFDFHIPLETAKEAAVPLPIQAFAFPEPFGAGKHILIADDNQATRDYLQEVLSAADFDIAPVPDGAEALRLAAERHFDLILIDQFMPDMTGWEVLKALHEQHRGTVPPVILCSAMRARRPDDFPEDLDFAAFQLKPVPPNRLLQAVKEALGVAAPAPATLSRLPATMLERLKLLVDGGNITAVTEWADAMSKDHPEYADFASAVEKAALDIDFPTLTELASAYDSRPKPGPI